MKMKLLLPIIFAVAVMGAVYMIADSEDSDAAVVDPSTGTQVGDLYYTFSGTDATVVGISSSLSSATSITIPDTVESGGTTYNVTAITDVFSGLLTLETVTLSNNLTSIGVNAFYGCTSLALTSLPSGLTSINGSAFGGCTSLALTSLPDGVTSIGSSAFSGCTNLALTSLPSGLTSIGQSAFYGCTSLALTSLPDGVTSIGKQVFRFCTSLALTSLPDGVTSIGNYAFGGCTSLTSLSIPTSTTTIGSSAFSGCTSLALSLDVPVTFNAETETASWVTGIDSSGNPTYVVTIPNGFHNYLISTWTYDGTDYDSGDSVTMTAANRSITATLDPNSMGSCGDNLTYVYYADTSLVISGTGAMYNYITTTPAPWDSYKAQMTSVTFPDGMTTVGNYAFYEHTALTSLDLPDTVTTIGTQAFYNCYSIAGAMDLHEGITSIGSNAFYNCNDLTSLTIPSTLTELPYDGFNNCTGLTGTLVIPDTVTTINGGAFYNTKYTNLVILGSPQFALTDASAPFGGSDNFYEVLNLGDTEITAGMYGLANDCIVRSNVEDLAMIQQVEHVEHHTETTDKEGTEYTLMGLLPVLVVLGLVMAGLFALIRFRTEN